MLIVLQILIYFKKQIIISRTIYRMVDQCIYNIFVGLVLFCIIIRLFFCETYEKFDSFVLTDNNGNLKTFDKNAKEVSITLPNGMTKQILRINDNGDFVITSNLVVEGNSSLANASLTNSSLTNSSLANSSLTNSSLISTSLEGTTSLTGPASSFILSGVSGVDPKRAPAIKGIYMGTGQITVSNLLCSNTARDYVHNLNLSGNQFIFTTITNADGGMSFPILKVVSYEQNKFVLTCCNNASNTVTFNWIIFVT